MKSIFYLLLLSLFFSKTTVYSQNSTAVTELINRTEVSILKAQKEIISGHSPKKTQELSMAVKYQVLALESFNNNDLKMAVCYSLKAREFSNSILVQMKLNGVDYFLPNSSETQLGQQNNYNSSDVIYSSKISTDSLDEAILYDNEKLRSTYILSL